MIEFMLPIPPSTNALYFNLPKGGRAKTEAYKSWLEFAQIELLRAFREQGSPTFPDKQKMRLTARVGCNYKRDVSNCVKPAEDALSAFLPIPDDRYNDEIIAKRDQSLKGEIHLRLEAI
jgi:Holliday junction resolvase RusA-like endonuclease